MNYQPVIGLEVHVELNTKSKMFCRCSADYFGKPPNTLTCPVCLGLPGALPYINEEAINKCIQIGLALNCSVNPVSYFERKNYFYPDLPKGFQISQYILPIATNGWIEVDPLTSTSAVSSVPNGSGKKGKPLKIRINRAHQEEDTGKLSHIGGVTLIDFNRSGVPLVEIVTEPDFTETSPIKDYAKKLQQVFRYLGVSNADMERGDMRLEANVSVRKASSHLSSGKVELPNYRVELKNINSFRFMVAAVEFEIKRQIKALGEGEKLTQETRGWNEDKRETYLQRSKEEAHDYRYFPEPDLPELRIENSQFRVEQLKKALPQLPWELSTRFIDKYGIKLADAKILTESKGLAQFFEQAIKYGQTKDVKPQVIANYLVNHEVDLINSSPQQLVDDLIAQKSNVISDQAQLEQLAQEVISENSKAVEDFKKGKEAAIQVLIGAVMRKSSGKADVTLVRQVLGKLLK